MGTRSGDAMLAPYDSTDWRPRRSERLHVARQWMRVFLRPYVCCIKEQRVLRATTDSTRVAFTGWLANAVLTMLYRTASPRVDR
jgi:hypothetical protein